MFKGLLAQGRLDIVELRQWLQALGGNLADYVQEFEARLQAVLKPHRLRCHRQGMVERTGTQHATCTKDDSAKSAGSSDTGLHSNHLEDAHEVKR